MSLPFDLNSVNPVVITFFIKSQLVAPWNVIWVLKSSWVAWPWCFFFAQNFWLVYCRLENQSRNKNDLKNVLLYSPLEKKNTFLSENFEITKFRWIKSKCGFDQTRYTQNHIFCLLSDHMSANQINERPKIVFFYGGMDNVVCWWQFILNCRNKVGANMRKSQVVADCGVGSSAKVKECIHVGIKSDFHGGPFATKQHPVEITIL